jgi:hypothetical protein
MGIATSLKEMGGNHTKIVRIFVPLLLFLGTLTGILFLYAPDAGAATTYSWVDDRTIKATIVTTQQGRGNPVTKTEIVNYIDNNPNDTNRTFKATTGEASRCPNQAVNTITLGNRPSSGTLYIIGDHPRCDIRNQSISIGNLPGSRIATTNCGSLGGTADIRCEEDKLDGNAAWSRTCETPYPPAGPFCNTATAPPEGYAGTPTEEDQSQERKPHACDSLGDFSLRWVTCPILTAGVAFTDAADAIIEDQLHYGTQVFDTTTAAGKNFKSAWNTFRIVGLSLMLIVGLLMVVSQAAGLQIFDAYAFRKTLPRLLIAVIAIALSWNLLEFVIVFFNDIGHWVQDLILTPFTNEADPTSSNPFAIGTGIALVVSGSLLGGLASAILLGPLGIVSLIVTVILAIFIGLFVLLTRSAIITLTIITAPLAIACWVLPNTKKVWDLWQNALTTALFIFPIIMMFLAAGKAMSLVAEDGIMKILFLILPYALLPFAFRLAGGLMQTVFSLTNDKSRGAFDRLSNFRRDQVKNRLDDALHGTGKTWLSKTGDPEGNTWLARNGGIGGVMGRPLGSVYRRGKMASEHGVTAAGGATYTAAMQQVRDQRANEALKNDNGRAAGDDDGNAVAQQATSTGEFIRQYRARVRGSTGVDPGEAGARRALRNLEVGYGAKLGSEAMRVAAFKARGTSGTGYDSSGNYQEVSEDMGRIISSGLVTTQDAAAVFKANQKRGELNAIGFGSWMAHGDRVAARYAAGDRGAALVNPDEARALRIEANNGVMPGQLVAGRHETVRILAPQMIDTINGTLDQVDASGAVVAAGDDIALGRELAKIAGRYDAMAQSNPLNAEIMANEVMSHSLTRAAADPRFIRRDASGRVMIDPQSGAPQVMSVREMIDEWGRSNGDFLTMRREYATQAGQQAAAYTAAAAGAPGAGMPPPGGGMPGMPPSDRRLKTNIRPIGSILDSTVTLYQFRYFWSRQIYVGVMAQDLLDSYPEAVHVDQYGYYCVDYAVLGTQMYTLEEWRKQQKHIGNKPINVL